MDIIQYAINQKLISNGGNASGGSGGVTINNQDKTITENGVYQADEGYTGLGTVTVEVASTGGGDIDAILDGSISVLTSEVQSIANYKFYQSQTITEVNLPNATQIGSYAFNNCDNLTTVNIPQVDTISSYAFYDCSKLATVSADKVRVISSYAFNRCFKLENVKFKNLSDIEGSAFSMCTTLKKVDLYAIDRIQSNAFSACYSLKSVLVRKTDAICTLGNTNAFANCMHILGTTNSEYNPQGLKDGYIYVPKALVESYKTATNWSNFANQFRALEDYTVDGTITGELDESKI